MTLHPPLPVPDDLTQPYWDGVQQRKLLVQRCGHCGRYQFPPDAQCNGCGNKVLAFEEVSGRGKVFSFTEAVTGARHPYFQALQPYLVGFVELDEQEGLVFASNFPGSKFEDLSIGAPVQVEFQELPEGTIIPQFRLTSATQEGR
jgi:uncharacterized OB-fold protein